MLSFFLPQRYAAVVSQDERYWTSSTGFGTRTTAGVNVDVDSSLALATVFFCTRVITEGIAGMPIVGYKRTDKGGREAAKDGEIVRLAEMLTLAPNEEMTSMPWREGRTHHQVNYGNGFSEVVRDARGRPEGLYPIHPTRVSQSEDDNYAYAVRNRDGKRYGFRAEQILHVCGTISDDGMWGRGVIQHARESVGFGLAMQKHGSAYFGGGAQPPGILIVPGMGREDRRALRQEWKEVHADPGSSEVVILPKDGSAYTPIPVSNEDSQFLGSREFSEFEIGLWYRMQKYMIKGDGGKSPESLGVDFVTFTLAPWAIRQEQQYNFKLLTPMQRREYFFEHDFSSLLRGNREARYNSYRTGITSGVLTINDVCRMENLPDIGPDGDIHYLPANIITAERMAMDGGSSVIAKPGSDHTGAPADDPGDHDNERTPDPTREQRAHMETQLNRLHAQLEDRSIGWMAAARESLQDVLCRMFTKESGAAQRAVDATEHKSKENAKGDFASWRREYYARHEKLLVDALRPTCLVLAAAGVKKWGHPQELAAWLRARSAEALERSFDQDSREVFARKLAAWPTERARAVVEEVLAA